MQLFNLILNWKSSVFQLKHENSVWRFQFFSPISFSLCPSTRIIPVQLIRFLTWNFFVVFASKLLFCTLNAMHYSGIGVVRSEISWKRSHYFEFAPVIFSGSSLIVCLLTMQRYHYDNYLVSLTLRVIHLTSVLFSMFPYLARFSFVCLSECVCFAHSTCLTLRLHLIFVKLFTNWKPFWMHDSHIPTIMPLLLFRLFFLMRACCLGLSHFPLLSDDQYWIFLPWKLFCWSKTTNERTNKQNEPFLVLHSPLRFQWFLFVCLLVFRILHGIEVNSQQPIHHNGINIVIELFVPFHRKPFLSTLQLNAVKMFPCANGFW